MEPISEKHYEEKFEFPLWKMIKQRAEKRDISYAAAAIEVAPEYQKKIRYRDKEWANAQIRKRNEETARLIEQDSK